MQLLWNDNLKQQLVAYCLESKRFDTYLGKAEFFIALIRLLDSVEITHPRNEKGQFTKITEIKLKEAK